MTYARPIPSAVDPRHAQDAARTYARNINIRATSPGARLAVSLALVLGLVLGLLLLLLLIPVLLLGTIVFAIWSLFRRARQAIAGRTDGRQNVRVMTRRGP